MVPADIFSHGYFYDEPDMGLVAEQDKYDNISVADGNTYSITFSPAKRHMVGFEIFPLNITDNNSGYLIFEISNEKGKVIDNIEIDLSNVTEINWYKVYSSTSLKKGKTYTLTITSIDAQPSPEFYNVDSDYMPDEVISGNMPIAFAYADSTYTIYEKIIITIFLIAVLTLIFSICFFENKMRTGGIYASVLLFITSILSWNYMYNSMDVSNSKFDMQDSSEWYVSGVINAKHYGVTAMDGG